MTTTHNLTLLAAIQKLPSAEAEKVSALLNSHAELLGTLRALVGVCDAHSFRGNSYERGWFVAARAVIARAAIATAEAAP